jgi:hypothetical protein
MSKVETLSTRTFFASLSLQNISSLFVLFAICPWLGVICSLCSQCKQLPKRRIRNLARRMDGVPQESRRHCPRYKVHHHFPSARHTAANGCQLCWKQHKVASTDYVDVLYVHWWDFTTSVPELMQSLNALVASGKVLYLGVSDTPAWVVSKANECTYNPPAISLPFFNPLSYL